MQKIKYALGNCDLTYSFVAYMYHMKQTSNYCPFL